MMPDFVHTYLIRALSGTPDVSEALLGGLSVNDPRWDLRPYADRFTLREVVAHLADWNPIFEERIRRIRAEEEPILPSYDEGQVAIDNDYAHSNPVENLVRFRAGRATLIALASEIKENEWERAGLYRETDRMTLETYLAHILAHDGYHTAQMVEWVKSAGKRDAQ